MARTYGRYKVIEEVGHGSMGVVYKAFDSVIGRTVAVKVIRNLPWLSPREAEAYQARFRLEAQTAGPLQHPNVVTLYDVGDGYLVMEYLEGQTLANLLRARQRLTLGEVLHLCSQVAAALDFAHARGVVHRDLKPANLMVMPGGAVKIMDFGVARLRGEESAAEGVVSGSPAYMAPEQFLGQRADARADVFSLGVIAYEMLTGTRPFGGRSETAIVDRVKSAPAPSILAFNPALPAEYEDILRRALDKDPAVRFASAGQFVAALHLRRLDETDLGMLLQHPQESLIDAVARLEPAAAPVSRAGPPVLSPVDTGDLAAPMSPASTLPPTPRPRTTGLEPAAPAPRPAPLPPTVPRPDASPPRPYTRTVVAGAAIVAVLLGTLALLVTRPVPAVPAAPTAPAASSTPVAPPAVSPAPSTAALVRSADPLDAAGRTVLIVSSMPPEARVFLDGALKGATPVLIVDPPIGQALLRIEKDGYVAAYRLARIVSGQPLGLDVRLQSEDAPPHVVDLLSRPDGATLSVDGRVVGTTNALKVPLTGGFHVLEFQKDGFSPWVQELHVGPDTERVIVTLERRAP